jgi:hypothetical protein
MTQKEKVRALISQVLIEAGMKVPKGGSVTFHIDGAGTVQKVETNATVALRD